MNITALKYLPGGLVRLTEPMTVSGPKIECNDPGVICFSGHRNYGVSWRCSVSQLAPNSSPAFPPSFAKICLPTCLRVQSLTYSVSVLLFRPTTFSAFTSLPLTAFMVEHFEKLGMRLLPSSPLSSRALDSKRILCPP